MGRRRIISRIHKFIPKELMFKLNEVCHGHFGANNSKIDMIIRLLDEYGVNYVPVGGGTNRYAVRIDGYIFKFAMDVDGVNDNMIEFSMSKELQPYVAKTYECNGLIAVLEYVNVIRKEEFLNNRDNIRSILSAIADRFLFDDVGITTKNYLNWGYRDSGELVILDYGYIYRVTGREMVCNSPLDEEHKCDGFLDYNENFTMLRCPKCGRKFNIGDIRRRISQDYEKLELERSKASAYLLTSEYLDVDEDEPTADNYGKEDMTMETREFTAEELDAMYEEAILKCKNLPDAVYAEAAATEDDYDDEYDDTEDDGDDVCDDSETMNLPYQNATIFGVPCLFTTDRLDPQYIPEEVFKYDIRADEDDPDIPVSIENHVIRNFYGSVILGHELNLGEDGKVDIDEDELDVDYYSETYLREFIDVHVRGVATEVIDIDDGVNTSDVPTTIEIVAKEFLGDSYSGNVGCGVTVSLGDEDDDEDDDDDEFVVDPDDVIFEEEDDDFDDEDEDDSHTDVYDDSDDDDEDDDAVSVIVNSDNIREVVESAVETIEEAISTAVEDIVEDIVDDAVETVVEEVQSELISDDTADDLRAELAEALTEEDDSDEDDDEDEESCLIDQDVIAEALAEEEEEEHNRRTKNFKHKKNR